MLNYIQKKMSISLKPTAWGESCSSGPGPDAKIYLAIQRYRTKLKSIQEEKADFFFNAHKTYLRLLCNSKYQKIPRNVYSF